MSKIVTSRRLQSRVLLALGSGDGSLRTSEIADIVGASVTATRAALLSIGAVQVESMYPTEWTISTPTISEKGRVVPSKFTGVDYVVTTKAVSDLVSVWNAQCEALGKAIAASAVVADSDPKKMAKDLGTVAGSIASLSYALNDVAGKPDWLDILTPDK